MAKRRKRPPFFSLEELWAKHERKVNRAIGRFRTSYMSNAKWLKALRTLATPELSILGYRWKFVADERLFVTPVVPDHELEEGHLRDGRFQPFVYKEIEWLEVQTSKPDQITAVLANVGKFAVQQSNEGIRLLGYR